MTPVQSPTPQKRALSFSALTTLLRDPKEYKEKYIDKVYQPEQSQLVEGSLFHCLLLEPQNFDEKFLVQAAKLPGSTPKEFCDWYFNNTWKLSQTKTHLDWDHADTNTIILEWLSKKELYEKMSDVVKIPKVATPEAKEYLATLIDGELLKKAVVTYDMVQKLQKKVDAIRKYDREHDNFLLDESNTIIGRNEMDITAELPDRMFDLRGIMDRVKINYDTCTVDIIDYKGTKQKLTKWKETSFNTYLYKLQPAIYIRLFKSIIKADSNVNWKLTFWFIVCDSDLNVYPFKVTEESLAKWDLDLEEAFDTAEFHLKSMQFDLPKEYILREVVL